MFNILPRPSRYHNPAGLLFFVCLICLAAISPVFASNPITNYKSGISISFSGQDGQAYAFECWYYDPLIDDHGTVYIRDTTRISLAHNARNIAWVNPTDGDQFVGASVGVIRYKVDRDQQVKYRWSTWDNPSYVNPAYTQPFSFSGLKYGPEDPGVSVVGSVGPKLGIDINNRENYYCRGLVDSCGDEWHILSVGDDDVAVYPAHNDGRHKASDGKIHHFIVNPKTPAIFFSTAANGAQFYTTPVKSYFLPKLHEQTTYVTDNVNINLVNIMTADPVYYRFDQNAFQQYTGPVSTTSLTQGAHVLEYYYQNSVHRTRRIVKNPGFPSDADRFTDNSGHGYLLWKNDAEFQRIKNYLTTTSTSQLQTALQAHYDIFCDNNSQWVNCQEEVDNYYRKGHRELANTCLMNAFIAKTKGLNSRYTAYARKMLLENLWVLDPVGYELNPSSFDALASPEMLTAGYTVGPKAMEYAFGYDLLITDFRQPAYADGFTAIEDLKIRDCLARSVIDALLWRAGYVEAYQVPGYWGMNRQLAALICALAMPSYNTSYYGTSGFDGSPAIYKYVPFPDQAVTWKRLFLEDDVPRIGYPNNLMTVGVKVCCPEYADYQLCCIDTITGTTVGMNAYNSSGLAGGAVAVYANVMRIKLGRYESYLDKWFYKGNDGTQPFSHGMTRGFFPSMLCINQYFPDSVAQHGLDSTRDIWGDRDIYKIILVNEHWQTTGIKTSPAVASSPAGNLLPVINPVTGVLLVPLGNVKGDLRLTLYNASGHLVMTCRARPVQGTCAFDLASVADGIYVYNLSSAGYAGKGKLIKISVK